MADDDPDAPKTIPQQYREQAKTIRRQVGTMGGTVRRQLLVLADQYDMLADGIEGPRRGG
jgi:uncharacterized protein with GYD domain